MDRSVPKQRINAFFGKYKYPIMVVLVGLGLMLLPGKTQREPSVMPEETVRVQDLEKRLEAILSQIEGVGQVQVLLTVEAGQETLYQMDTQSEADRRTEDTVLVEDASRTETGLVRQIVEPRYRGAVIVCHGADQPSVRLAIVEAVRCLTGLGADRISVLNMK